MIAASSGAAATATLAPPRFELRRTLLILSSRRIALLERRIPSTTDKLCTATLKAMLNAQEQESANSQIDPVPHRGVKLIASAVAASTAARLKSSGTYCPVAQSGARSR